MMKTLLSLRMLLVLMLASLVKTMLKKLRRLLQRERHIKIELCVRVLCDYFKLVTLYKLGEVYFLLLGTNSFHVKAENEIFTAAGSCCRQNLKYENFTHVVVWKTTSKNCTKERAARVARLLFLI